MSLLNLYFLSLLGKMCLARPFGRGPPPRVLAPTNSVLCLPKPYLGAAPRMRSGSWTEHIYRTSVQGDKRLRLANDTSNGLPRLRAVLPRLGGHDGAR